MKLLIKSMLAITPLFAVDLIFFGGHIITMDDQYPSAEAIAIQYGKITAIGQKDENMKLKSWKTNIFKSQWSNISRGI